MNRLSVLIFKFLVLLIVAISFPLSAFAKKSEAQYWADTSIDIKHLFNPDHIDEKNCARSLAYYSACLAAIEALIGSADWGVNKKLSPPRYVIPVQLYKKYSQDFEKPDFESQFFVVAQPRAAVSNIPAAPEQIYKERKQRHQDRKAAIQEVYERHSRAGTVYQSITDLIELALKNFTAADRPKAALGHAANRFLSLAFDPHTSVRPEAALRDQLERPDEKLTGFGIEIGAFKENVVIENVFPESPAQIADLRRGDLILAVDNQPIHLKNLDLDQVAMRLKGPVGSKAKLLIQRAGQSVEKLLVRAEVFVPNVQVGLLGLPGQHDGYIKLRQFANMNDCLKIRAALAYFKRQNAKSIVLDLRGNPGGIIDGSVCIFSSFVDAANVLKNKRTLGYRLNIEDNTREEFVTPQFLNQFELWLGTVASLNRIELSTDYQTPMAVLIDYRSASASEIVAGVLQDLGRAWIIGQRSFGKGTAQTGTPGTWQKLNDLIFLRTFERYYLPSGRTPQIFGIEPDVVAMSSPDLKENPGMYPREETLFENAISAEGPKWQSFRPQVLAIMNSCINQTSPAKEVFKKAVENNSTVVPDYQLMVAQDAVWCESKMRSMGLSK